jgi:hypothetical protein
MRKITSVVGALLLTLLVGCGRPAVQMADPKTAAPPPPADALTPLEKGISPADAERPAAAPR